MSITILRWKSGSGGDTVLKMLLESNNLHSQNRFLTDGKQRTRCDLGFVKQFKYDQIAKMSLTDFASVDPVLLQQQLSQLDQDDPTKQWLLKSHNYIKFDYPVIDIIVSAALVPFVVKASLAKNTRAKQSIADYHPIVSKFSNEDDLYKFDCYNFTYDRLKTPCIVETTLSLEHILGGWDQLTKALLGLGFKLNYSCKEYYDNWLSANQQYLPGEKFKSMLESNDYDYKNVDLSIEEKYCFLVLSDEKFRLLS